MQSTKEGKQEIPNELWQPPLPLNRLDAFTRMAVDFGGPFITIQGS